jgi:hypothetical protein
MQVTSVDELACDSGKVKMIEIGLAWLPPIGIPQV